MLAAPTLDDVLNRAEFGGRTRPLRDRLVSIVFANPHSAVVRDLRSNRMLWDELTGEAWDVFFAGYYAYGSQGDKHPILLGGRSLGPGGEWKFSPKLFSELLQDVERELDRLPETRRLWSYSGHADVVSIMVYGGDPDWLSLSAVELAGRGACAEAPSLGHVIEGLRRWQDSEPDRRFAPGEVTHGPSVTPEALASALRWTAVTASAGVIGNRVDEIVTGLFG